MPLIPLEEVIEDDLLGKEVDCCRALWAFVNRSLNANGFQAAITSLGDPITFRVVKQDKK